MSDRRGELSRRALLGSGIAALTATLPSLRPREAWGQAMTPPKRLIVMCTSNGTQVTNFWPTGGETSFTLSPILRPLMPYRSKLLILQNVPMASTREGPGAAHQKGIGQMLTGVRLLEGSFAGGGGETSGFASGISIDQHIANAVARDSRFPSLQFAVRQGGLSNRSYLSYRGSNQPMPAMQDPYAAFDRIFAGFAPGTDMRLLRAQQRSVLDNITRDLAALSGRASAADRARLDAHLTSIREVETRLMSAAGTGATCTRPMLGTRLDPANSANYPTIGRLQMDVMAAAMACGLTRIATFQWSSGTSGQTFPWIGVSDGHHTLSHAGDSDTTAQNKLTQINTWYAQQFAYLLGKLEAVTEGAGTMLDNTVVLWGNELGKGNTHTRENIPWVMAGSCGGYFRTGRFVRYATAQPHNNLLVSLANAMGVTSTTRFGNPTYCTGPLANLR